MEGSPPGAESAEAEGDGASPPAQADLGFCFPFLGAGPWDLVLDLLGVRVFRRGPCCFRKDKRNCRRRSLQLLGGRDSLMQRLSSVQFRSHSGPVNKAERRRQTSSLDGSYRHESAQAFPDAELATFSARRTVLDSSIVAVVGIIAKPNV